MDTLAHALWTNALFYTKYARDRRLRYWAAFFGVLPDLIAFTPLLIYLVLTSKLGPNWFMVDNWTARYAREAYQFSHSLVIFVALFAVVTGVGNLYLWLKDRGAYQFWLFWPLLGWAVHILIDIPTHPNIYHTPFLFPLSGYMYTGGISWAHPLFFAVNYSLLVVVYILLYRFQKRRHDREGEPKYPLLNV